MLNQEENQLKEVISGQWEGNLDFSKQSAIFGLGELMTFIFVSTCTTK